MTDIQFQDEQMYGRPVAAKEKGLTVLVQKWGLAKDARHAEYVLIGVAIVATVFAVAIMFLTPTSSIPIVPVDVTKNIHP